MILKGGVRVVDLTARTPCDAGGETGASVLPFTIGDVRLEELDAGVITLLAPYGDGAALSAALEAAHGVAYAKPGRSVGTARARCVWFGQGQALLIGPGPAADLAQHGAMVEQSDGWAVVSLSGDKVVDVLARLVPVDLRAGTFKRGHCVRTMLGHMSVSITRTAQDRMMILVFQSMANTLIHELEAAMRAVAARRIG